MATQIEERLHTGSTNEDIVLPPSDLGLIKSLDQFLAAHPQAVSLITKDERVDLPEEALRVLKNVVRAMARGQAVSVASVNLRLTTGQAADMLGVSRQTLIRLLDQRKLSYERPSDHRMIRLTDVLAYKRQNRVEIRATLADMTRQAGEDGLYDNSYEMYENALKQSRKKRGEILAEMARNDQESGMLGLTMMPDQS